MVKINSTMFFDSKKVLKALDKAEKAVLSKFGAYIRTTARRSIRSRKKTASPGSPPSSHIGTLKRLIFFGYDTNTKSVVVGPQLFNGKSGGGSKTVANVLEQGGTRNGVAYDKFPFMAPALDQNKDKFAGLFANAVRN